MAGQTDGSIRIDTGLDSTGFEKGSEQMQRAAESLEQTITRSGENIQHAVDGMFTGASTAALNDEMSRAEVAIAKAELKLQKAQQALADFAQTEIPTGEYKKLTSEAEKTEAALLRLYDRRDAMSDMGISEDSAQWQRLQLQIESAERKLGDFERSAEAMRQNGTAFIPPETTTRFQELSLSARQAELDLSDLRSRAEDAGAGVGSAFRERASAALDGFKEKVASAAKAVGDFAKKMAKAAWDKFKSGVKSIASHIKNIGKNSSSSALTANKLVKTLNSFKSMLVSRIKRTFVSYLSSELGTAMRELAKFDGAYDKSVSNMRNRTTELSANIASSLGSLIKTVEPYITAAINAVSNAMAKISAMLAALRGEKTVTVAKQQTASYAASLSDSAKSANDAAAAQKKLNASLSGYDQLHKLSDNSDNGSSGGASGGASPDLFETVSVDSVLPDFGQEIVGRIKESIANGDWYGAGAAVADGLNQIVSAIDGKIIEIGPKAEQWATNLAIGLNGLTENVDGYAIGKMLADGVNLAFNTLDAFITTYNWAALGEKIGQGINGFFLETDWEKIGQTFGDGINAVFSVLYSTITNIKWRESGTKVGQGLNKLFKTVDWKKLGETFGESVKGVLGFLASAIEEVDWFAFGEDVKVALENVDWDGISDALFELIGAAFGGIFAFLCGLLGDAITDLADWWNTTAFTEEGKFTLEGLYKGLIDAAAGIIEWVDEHIVQPFIEGFKKALGINSPSTVMAEQGDYIIQGLLQGIKEKWASVPSWLLEKAGALISGVKEKWDSLKNSTSQKFAAIKDSVQQKMATAKQNAIDKAQEIRQQVGEKWESIKGEAESKWGSIKSRITGKAESIRSDLSGKWAEVQSNASSKFSDLKTTLEGKMNTAKASLGNISFKSIGENIVSGLKTGITNTWSTVSSKLTELAGGLVDDVKDILGIASPSKVFAQIGGFITAGLDNGIADGERAVMRTVGDMASSMIDTLDVNAPSIGVDDRMLSGLSQVAARFEAIARAFAAIDRAITSMGGLMVPQMATGTVIPAKVAVADDPRAGSRYADNGEMIALIKKIIALLDGKDDNKPSGGTRVPVEVVAKIERRELARALAEIDLSTGRSTNGGGRR